MPGIKDVLATLLDSWFLVDEQRRIKENNRTFLELSGSRKVTARDGLPAHCYDMIKLEICQKDCIALRALKAGRAVQVNEIHGKSLDGRDLVLVGSATPLREKDGSVSSILVTYRDVTEETHLRERLHLLEREARQEKDVLIKNLTEKAQELEEARKELQGLKRRGSAKAGG